MKPKLQQLRDCLQDLVEERRRVNTAIAKLKTEITIEERLQAAKKPEERVAA